MSRATEIRRRTVHAALDQYYEGSGKYDWPGLARPDQWPPSGDHWTTWLMLGGRGAGKTRAGAEWVRMVANGLLGSKAPCIALVGETYADTREVMIEGASGIKAVEPPGARPVYQGSRRRLAWPNGAVAYCFSAEDPDGLRGYQFDAAWSDEICKWRYADETWSNLQLALRLGEHPRQVATTTPRPLGLIKRLIAAETTEVTRAASMANRENLSPAFFSEIVSAYEGTALGRQELYGELIEEVPGALWTWAMIEAARISVAPECDRIVVAVDPPATSGPDADECGIIVAGVAGDADGCDDIDTPTAYILADRSVQGLSPAGWAKRVVAAFEDYDADRVVVEVNQGGEMVRSIIGQVGANIPIREVRATRGKRLRAEPVAALYERGVVRHVGGFSKLEDQLTTFTGDRKGESPDRVDALVWALTDLLLNRRRGVPGVRRFD